MIEWPTRAASCPPEMIFARTPAAMVTGDGRALSTGPVPAIYPGPLLPNVLQQSITPEGTQTAAGVGRRARLVGGRRRTPATTRSPTPRHGRDDHGRRHDVPPPGVRPRHRHRVRPRPGQPVDLRRGDDRPAVDGRSDELGTDEPYLPPDYLIQCAMPIDLATTTFDVEPTVERVARRRAGPAGRRSRVRRAARRRRSWRCSPTQRS